jgi:hypothetical protein
VTVGAVKLPGGFGMTRLNQSTASAHALKHSVSPGSIWFSILGLLLIISLGCTLSIPAPPVNPVKPTKPVMATVQQVGFEKTDCSVASITFSDITVSYDVNDIYDGPYLICSSSSTGAHGLSENAYISIIAYKADEIGGFYLDMQKNIQGFVDQANEWNADPDLPAEAKDEVTFIRNDQNGYVFMISYEANVQKCYSGSGYGAELVNGKYLVHLSFQSCELADAAAYTAVMQALETAALTAIDRVEAARQP